MDKRIIKSSASAKKGYQGDPRFEHWYVDNQVYFITARCRGGYPAFDGDQAKRIFWDRFDNYTLKYRFTPWVTSLLSNHYHTLGYAKDGTSLGQMMRRLHGSVAKLVNDLLGPPRSLLVRAGAPGLL